MNNLNERQAALPKKINIKLTGEDCELLIHGLRDLNCKYAIMAAEQGGRASRENQKISVNYARLWRSIKTQKEARQ